MIEEMLVSLLSSSISGTKRRRDFEHYYFKIGLIVTQGNVTQTASYLGYSDKAVHNRLNQSRELRSFRDELVRARIYQKDMEILEGKRLRKYETVKDETYYGLEDIQGRSISILELRNRHIEKTKNKYWFKNETAEEQEKIIERIKKLYSHGEPTI